MFDGIKRGNDINHLAGIYLITNFKSLCLFSGCLPLIVLVICFVTAYIFQYDDVHEDYCKVYNIIPSISAITGISPQRYLWRICVALHIGPRFIIASVYYNYHLNLFNLNPDPKIEISYKRLTSLTYWLNIIEISSLCGVTYISNVENYPIHEKLFIAFMLSSLFHMLVNIKLLKMAKSISLDETKLDNVLKIKIALFTTSIIASVGLVLFFMKHRMFCHDLAFSWFALCEYIIASCNLAYHIMVAFDFPNEKLMVATNQKIKIG